MNGNRIKPVESTLGQKQRKEFIDKIETLMAGHAPAVDMTDAMADMWELRVTWGNSGARRAYTGVFSVMKRGMTEEQAMEAGLTCCFAQIKHRYAAWIQPTGLASTPMAA